MKKVLKFLVIIILILFLFSCKEKAEEKEDNHLYVEYIIDKNEESVIEEVIDLSTYSLKEFEKEGFDFLGWFNDGEYEIPFSIDQLDDIETDDDITYTIYAKWSRKRFKVEFKCGNEIVSVQTVLYGYSASAPEAKKKAGYVFKSWDKDYTFISEDLVINAIYEETEMSENIIVVLGNWMNDDGTISQTMRKRLELALQAIEEFKPSFVVVTGGMANSKAGISEAQAMYNYLVEKGINPDIIIKEDQSMSTYQNAVYTMTKIQDIEFSNLIVVSTIEHFTGYQTIKYFSDAMAANSKIKSRDVKLMIYTNMQ